MNGISKFMHTSSTTATSIGSHVLAIPGPHESAALTDMCPQCGVYNQEPASVLDLTRGNTRYREGCHLPVHRLSGVLAVPLGTNHRTQSSHRVGHIMTGIILAELAAVTVAAYVPAILPLAADEVVEKSASLARMVSGVADLTSGELPQKSEPRSRDIAAQPTGQVGNTTLRMEPRFSRVKPICCVR